MGYKYYLQFKGECICLDESRDCYLTEKDLLAHLTSLPITTKIHLMETKVKLLFNRFESIGFESSSWTDNLKTLLAHDFTIYNASTNKLLSKSYKPVQFKLYSEKTKEHHHFGYFHTDEYQPLHHQFIKLCNMTDYPVGMNRHILVSVLVNDGGYIVAIEPDKTTILVQRNSKSGIITGNQQIIEYLSDISA